MDTKSLENEEIKSITDTHYTAHEAAAILGQSPSSIYGWARKGLIKNQTVGGKKVWIPKDEVSRLLNGGELRKPESSEAEDVGL